MAGLEKNSGFKINLKLLVKLIKAIIYGDMLQTVLHKNKAYEVNKGESEKLTKKWIEKCKEKVVNSNMKEFNKVLYDIIEDFEKIELDTGIVKPKVGIVGEILIKYHPFGNNFVAESLEQEGAEVIIPEFMGFIKYVMANEIKKNKYLKTGETKAKIYAAVLGFVDKIEEDYKKAIQSSEKGYFKPSDILELADYAEEILSTGNQTGEGWLLTGEMVEFIKRGVPNIICLQPFACLPNHVVGKGVIKSIRNKYPEANIAPIDYDPGASQTNQTNRIKLMHTVAKDNLQKEQKNNLKIDEKESMYLKV